MKKTKVAKAIHLTVSTPLAVLLFMAPVDIVTAASIAWTSAIDTTGKEQLLDGTVVQAINGGGATTIQGAGTGGAATYQFSAGSHASTDWSPATSARSFTAAGSSGTGDTEFDQLINSFSYATSGLKNGVYTINGLTPGQQYSVQIFYNDQRGNLINRFMQFSDGEVGSQSVAIQAGGFGWGQHAIGTFVADSQSQKITHTTDGFNNIHFTAMLVVQNEQNLNVPTASIYGDIVVNNETFDAFVTFSEDVSGLAANDFIVDNGDVLVVAGSGRHYRIKVAAAQAGNVEITLSADAAASLTSGLSNLQPASLSVTNQASFEDAWIVNEQSDWIAARQDTNMQIDQGSVTSDAPNASYTSIVQSFPDKRSASTFTLKQSPVWDNWQAVSNVGPSNARNAPVMVSVSDNNYYFLGGGSSGGYHAWHSTDMQNWVERGPVTPPGDGRWVTSAEFKDGEFFIYADAPNDQNPHLFVDSNLDDGIAGEARGAAFVKDNCGSDASFFRNDSDGGLFHIIYEDWSPIHARSHSWDSPLAGHASSRDGLTGFEDHEHMPPVDHRTIPTGQIEGYSHPEIGTCFYEVHFPAQDAYGDWTTIKVGEQYYMFSDYDQEGSGIRTARFTSDSIYGEFDLVGALGDGHPDPTVGFAEGQFYLITQQNTDYVSPGPWVDGVEARVGVDENGDQIVDTWTNWQSVSERYDHKPGFIRVVSKTPAQLDLSGLPSGYGFQFEIRVDNSVVENVAPIINRVELSFGEGADGTETNLALNQPVTQSSTDFSASASRAVDGDTNGRFSAGSVTHTQRRSSLNPWWRVDLGATEDISQINIFNRTDNCCSDRLNGAKVYVGNVNSTNPADYTEVGTLTDSRSVQSINGINTIGRYVMVRIEGSAILSLAEVEVLGAR